MSEKTNSPSSSPTMPSALLIDVRSAFDRGWHASRKSEQLAHLDSSRAAACAAMMVLLPVLGSAVLDETYRYALFAWDEGYHKTDKPRKPKPDGFYQDYDYFRKILPRFVGGAHFGSSQAEADDVVATAAVTQMCEGSRSCVISGDKDLKQLACRATTYYCLNRKTILSPQTIMDTYNIRHPAHLAVWLAVIGDDVDGIPGVERWAAGAWNKKVMGTAPKEMTMQQLIDHVASVIPDKQMDNFMSSLDATLLNDSIPGVPLPAKLESLSIGELQDEGLNPITRNYAKFRGDLNEEDFVPVESAVDRDE